MLETDYFICVRVSLKQNSLLNVNVLHLSKRNTFLLTELDNHNLLSLAAQIVKITGYHTRMRYPDGTDIPAYRYTSDQAKQVVQLALDLLQKVQDSYIC